MMKHIESIIARKAPEGWRWFRSEHVGGGDFLLTGGIPVGFFTRGPRKGKPKWDTKSATKFVVTKEELAAERDRFEREEGRCHECYGDGQVFSSWSVSGGVCKRKCNRCDGTGAARKEGV